MIFNNIWDKMESRIYPARVSWTLFMQKHPHYAIKASLKLPVNEERQLMAAASYVELLGAGMVFVQNKLFDLV